MIVNNAYLSTLLLEYSPLCALFRKNNEDVRFVGGIVREAFKSNMNKIYTKNLYETNIDMATTMKYDNMVHMLSTNNVKVVVNSKLNQMCTISYNNALVNISSILSDWENDSRRRDLTINSLYYDFDKKLHDYTGGYTDLMLGNINFNTNIDASLVSDPLRAVRYIRFYASHGINEIPNTILYKLEDHIAKSFHRINKNKFTIEIFKLFDSENKNLKNTLVSLENTQIMQILFSVNSINYNDVLRLLESGYKIGAILFTYTFLEYSCKRLSHSVQITNKQLAYLEKLDSITSNVNKIFDLKDIIVSNTYNKHIILDCLLVSFVKKRNVLFKYKNHESIIKTYKHLDKAIAFIDKLNIPKFEITNYDLLQLDYNPKVFQDILYHTKVYWYDNEYANKEKCIDWIVNFYNSK